MIVAAKKVVVDAAGSRVNARLEPYPPCVPTDRVFEVERLWAIGRNTSRLIEAPGNRRVKDASLTFNIRSDGRFTEEPRKPFPYSTDSLASTPAIIGI